MRFLWKIWYKWQRVLWSITHGLQGLPYLKNISPYGVESMIAEDGTVIIRYEFWAMQSNLETIACAFLAKGYPELAAEAMCISGTIEGLWDKAKKQGYKDAWPKEKEPIYPPKQRAILKKQRHEESISAV